MGLYHLGFQSNDLQADNLIQNAELKQAFLNSSDVVYSIFDSNKTSYSFDK